MTIERRTVLVGIVSVVFSGCVARSGGEAPKLRAATQNTTLGPGDIFRMEIVGEQELPKEFQVAADGTVSFPYIQDLHVQGLEPQDVAKLVRKALIEQKILTDPSVVVSVIEYRSKTVTVLGQVQKPGTYPITKPTTLISALSDGGGLLSSSEANEVSNPDAADLERSILIRDGSLIPVNFESLVREGDMSQNVYVRGGDYIFVPSLTKRSFYVLGAVNRPGPVYFERNATVLSAVAASGGPLPHAIVSKALILRGGTLKPRVAVVNIKAIMKGQSPDLKLEGGDIVWVPKSPWTKLENYVEAVLVTAAQAVAVQEGLGVLGATGSAGVTITAGGN